MKSLSPFNAFIIYKKVDLFERMNELKTSREGYFCSRNALNSEGIQGEAVFSPAQFRIPQHTFQHSQLWHPR